MRRILGPLLVGLGVFLLLGGLLLKIYAYPKLAIVPADQNSITRLEAKGATLFDTSTLKPITTDLSVANRTVGDVKATEAQGGDTRVWVSTTSIRSSDGTIRSRSASRTAFNGKTAEAVNCCDNFNESTQGDRTAVKRSGLVFKWPFATQKKTYPIWDDTLDKTVATKFVKTSSIDGLKVYEFRSEVPRTQVGTQTVPGSVVGETGASVDADSMYANTKTIMIEPVTGAIVDQRQVQTSTLAVNGEDRLTTTAATISYTKAQVAANVKDFKSKATQLSLVKSTLPLVGIILGLLAIVGGVLLSRRPEPQE
jgi:hypothetical protein